MFRQALWLGLFKHQSPKRTLLWSTSRAVGLFNLGTLTKHNYRCKVSTSKRYKDKHGRVRYQGSDALKGTQYLGLPDLSEVYSHHSGSLVLKHVSLRQYTPKFAGAVVKAIPSLKGTTEPFQVPRLDTSGFKAVLPPGSSQSSRAWGS